MTNQIPDPDRPNRFFPNSFQVPNILVDKCLAYLTGNEFKCVACLARKIFGWQKTSDRIARSQIMKITGLSGDTVDKAMGALGEFGIVLRLSENDSKNRGIEWALQINGDLVRFDLMEARLLNQEKANQQKTSNARQKRIEKAGGDVQHGYPKKPSVEQKRNKGGDVQHTYPLNVEQVGGVHVEQVGGMYVQHATQKTSFKPTQKEKLKPPSHQTSLTKKTEVNHEPEITESNGRAGWDFNLICQNNVINPRSKKNLANYFADEQTRAQKLLAWVLYAYSPHGKNLQDSSGVSKAIKSLCSAEPEFAPQKFLQLVKLGPDGLRNLFDRDYDLDDLGQSAEAKTYQSNFASLDPARKSDLYFRLFGIDSPEPATQPKPRVRQLTKLEVHREQVRLEKEAELQIQKG